MAEQKSLPSTDHRIIPPNVFVAGTHKAGTTFLCWHLAKHPAIHFSKVKEPMFFNKPVNQDKYESYLDEHFLVDETRRPKKHAAEGSTTYFQNSHALGRIRKFVDGRIRAIVCLRQPVAKAVSFYMHLFDRKSISGRERIIDLHQPSQSVLSGSQYASHAARWIKGLGRENVLFLTYDQLEESPHAFVSEACKFLGVRAPNENNFRNGKINSGIGLVRRWDFFEPDLEGAEKTPAEWQTVPRIYQHELALLQAYFKEDVEETMRVTGLDLSSWLKLPGEFERA